ncbi:GMC oxidoreductase [Rhizoctonia solani]|uniref:GMC oxidoreductase n=1 Tax=Rhizoctonia solani TaxID=456999 RepID=A0A8H8NMZ5_9AGAM|nr:GMC oxidoreductase [Rhizoctonia solani]QRW16771.1 GMC oxidoreductase [Rhizoctonia solani]
MRTALSLLSLAIPALGAGIVYNDQIDAAYDFVIAGGGLAGLVLASRLSEDSNTTVLVLEAGASDIPGNAYYSSLLNTDYDWQYMTVPQLNAGNRVLPWPRGKVLGGSTAVNGLYLVRPSAIEVDAWSQLLPGQSSAAAWSWASLFEAMKKSETFTEPSDAIKNAGRIQYDVTSHGRSGPLHYAYPGFIVPVVGNWTSTLDWVGIPPSPDANGGSGWGAFIATSSINPSNWTRSYSRSAYIDPLGPRPNLAILPNATVTKIIWEPNNDGNGKKVAQGVEFAASRGAPRRSVTARKEVILAGGAIGSPNIAMHSGIGPRPVLEGLGIPVVYELPGVGAHLQDHIATEVVFRTTAETAASIRGSGTLENGTSAPFLSFINSAIAYANITDLFGDWAPTFQEQVRANMSDNVNALVPNDPRVKAGYQAVYEATTEKILMSQAGQVELLFSLTGTSQGSDTIAIQAALQHPFSQGHLYINSTDPFDPPVIDPRYLSNPGDIWMTREGLKLARKLGQTQPLNGSIVEEVSPGASVQTDAEWDAWLKDKIQTEYHPSCTMSMLPEEQAGVVDADLRMYGTSNVRVVDSSIYPIQFAAHLMAPTYGMAEQAASIIRAQYNGVPPPASTVPTSASGSATQTANPNNGNGNNTNGGVVGLKSNNALWAALCLMAGLVMVI